MNKLNKYERIVLDLEKAKEQILKDKPARMTLSSGFLIEVIELVEKQDNFILELKPILNNIQFEVERVWRKIEKMEDEKNE